MNSDDLELYSTEELVEEILRRTTFQGVIVHSRDQARNRDWSGVRIFSVRHNDNFDAEQAGRLLGVVSQHLAAGG